MAKVELIHGDCLRVMCDIESKSVSAIIADLPYEVTSCHWDTIIPFEPLWEQYKRIIKSNGAIVLTAGQPFTSKLIMSNLEWFKYCWVWEKNSATNFLNAKKQPLRQTEDVAVFYNKQPIYNPQKTTGHKPVNNYTIHSFSETLGKMKAGVKGGGQTDRHPTNVLRFNVVQNDNSNGDKLHPNQKPIALMEYLISTYTNEGDLILDNSAGSGSTGIAAHNLNRKAILIEKDFGHFQVAKKRIKDAQKQQKLF